MLDQKIEELHIDKGGGHSKALGMDIQWQDGVLVDGEPNGCFVETVIRAVKGRLEHYQSGSFACSENAMAIDALDTAFYWLERRRTDREKRGVRQQLRALAGRLQFPCIGGDGPRFPAPVPRSLALAGIDRLTAW